MSCTRYLHSYTNNGYRDATSLEPALRHNVRLRESYFMLVALHYSLTSLLSGGLNRGAVRPGASQARFPRDDV